MQNNKKKVNNAIVVIKYLFFITNYYPKDNDYKRAT